MTSAGRTVLFGVAGVVAICAFSTVGMGIFSLRIMLDKVQVVFLGSPPKWQGLPRKIDYQGRIFLKLLPQEA